MSIIKDKLYSQIISHQKSLDTFDCIDELIALITDEDAQLLVDKHSTIIANQNDTILKMKFNTKL